MSLALDAPATSRPVNCTEPYYAETLPNLDNGGSVEVVEGALGSPSVGAPITPHPYVLSPNVVKSEFDRRRAWEQL